jgi:hypothetical protein
VYEEHAYHNSQKRNIALSVLLRHCFKSRWDSELIKINVYGIYVLCQNGKYGRKLKVLDMLWSKLESGVWNGDIILLKNLQHVILTT